MVGKTQYSPLYNYKVASIGFYSPLSLVLRLKVFFNNDYCLKLQFPKGLDHIVKYSADNMSMKEACPEW